MHFQKTYAYHLIISCCSRGNARQFQQALCLSDKFEKEKSLGMEIEKGVDVFVIVERISELRDIPKSEL